MSEEVHNATLVVPRTMVLAILINGALGFGMTLTMVFCIGDVTAALQTPTGYPFLEIFQQGLQSTTGAAVVGSLFVVFGGACATTILAACSRLTWAFARDAGMPGHRLLSRVHAGTQLPLWSIGLTATVSVLLSLINIGSTTALNAFLSLTVSAWLGSYMLPIGLVLWRRLFHPETLQYGPWRLGWIAIPTNVFALSFSIVIFIFSFFPATLPVTPQNMNWSSVLCVGVVAVAFVFYLVHGRSAYKGPIVETSMEDYLL